MSRIPVKTDAIILFCFFLVFALLYTFGISQSKSTLTHELRKSAFDQAERWSRFIETNSELLDKILAGEAVPVKHKGQVQDYSLISGIFHYEIYKLNGELIIAKSSGLYSKKLNPTGYSQRVSLLTGEIHEMANQKVSLFRGDGNSVPRYYAVARFIIHENGQPVGIAVSYINQTQLFEALSTSFNWIRVLTSIFFTIGMLGLLAASGFGLWRNLKTEQHFKILEASDKLTGLDNRDTFLRSLTRVLTLRRRLESDLVVICLDVDRFKELNDSLSHDKGDTLLVDLARRLKEVCREGDIVARLSGDEFAVACLGLTQAEQVRDFINLLQEQLSRPYIIDGESVVCTLSMGVSIAPADGDTASILLKSADLALCRSKAEGRNTYRFFDKDMDQSIRHQRTLAYQLKQAANLDQLEIYFQPQIDLATGKLAGTEALLRWNHPNRGTIGPSEFISIAEVSGQMAILGEWVLRSACMTASTWNKPYTIAVNLSPTQFQNVSISELVSDVLMESGLEPDRLELEITESQLMKDSDMVVEELSKLKTIGVKVAIDDFGSGYSSLGYLSRFKFDKLKIDKCFIRNLSQGSTDEAIVKTIVGLGHALDVKIIAEGVETPEQAELLKSLGCHQVQGYLYGYPETEETFNRLLIEISTENDKSEFAA